MFPLPQVTFVMSSVPEILKNVCCAFYQRCENTFGPDYGCVWRYTVNGYLIVFSVAFYQRSLTPVKFPLEC